jgi:uncharacterized Zn-finger protein
LQIMQIGSANDRFWRDFSEIGRARNVRSGRVVLKSTIGRVKLAPQMESHPKFHNEGGVPIVRIGCREFKCIGDKPPQDHPHIYLNMGDANEIVCPYCSTLFCFDPSLGVDEADPANCAYSDID